MQIPMSISDFLRGVCSVLLITCISNCNRTPPEYRDFLNLPIEQQYAKLRTLPIDKQIDYYLAATSYVHPPELELGDIIASEGKEAVPFLVKRLRAEKQEHRQIMLLYVFEHMNRFNYKLKNEKEALDLLREVAANMKDNKVEAERVLDNILEDRPPDLKKLKEEHPEYFPPNR
jgi:hypothetical protein